MFSEFGVALLGEWAQRVFSKQRVVVDARQVGQEGRLPDTCGWGQGAWAWAWQLHPGQSQSTCWRGSQDGLQGF